MNENPKLSETLRGNASGRGMSWLNLMADKAEKLEKDIAAYKGMGDKYEKEIARKDAAIAEQARQLQAALARVVEVERERDGDDICPVDVYQEAINLWGEGPQVVMVFEEMSELQKELCKHVRGKNNIDQIAEEIADVRIMLDQMTVLYDCAAETHQWKIKKLERLQEILKQNGGVCAENGGVTRDANSTGICEQNQHDPG